MELEPSITELLKRINEIQGKFTKRCEQGFNVFSLCGVDHYELWHSKIIAHFLSPQGSHGFKGEFLRAFAECFGIGKYSDNAIVRTEVMARGDRFDILIEDKETGHVCIIENKIFAAEQPEQMKRYKSWLDQKKRQEMKSTYLMFLTLNGRKSDTLEDGYTSIAYSAIAGSGEKSICSWIDRCAEIAKEVPFVRETLCQYREHIKRIATGESAMDHEIQLELIKRMRTAEAVYRNYQAACMYFATQILEIDVIEELKRRGHEFRCENGLSLTRRESGVLYAPVEKPTDEELKGQIYVIFEETGLTYCQVGLYQDINNKIFCICNDEAFNDAVSKCFSESEGWHKINKQGVANEPWPIWCPIFAGKGITDCPHGINWDGKFFDDYRCDTKFREKLLSEIAKKVIVLYKLQSEIAEKGVKMNMGACV